MRISLLAVAAGCLALTLGAPAAQVTVFAASSLSDALKELGRLYDARGPDRVRFNFAGSGTLARQIEAGAPADIFFSADDGQMRTLETNGLVVVSARRDRLSNRLVIVTSTESPPAVRGPADLARPDVRRIVTGDPRAVPVGIYARAWLEKRNLWETLRRKMVPAESARRALALVESGNADAGIVYATDARPSRKVKIVYEVPADEAPQIIYPVARVKTARPSAPAARFLEFLWSKAADEVFAKYGFVVLPQGT